MQELGSVTMSAETMGSSVYCKIPFSGPSAAFFIAALISAAVTSRASSTVRSVAEPVGTGTRSAYPSNLPFKFGSTRLIALAAPVEVGMIESAPARARRRSLCG